MTIIHDYSIYQQIQKNSQNKRCFRFTWLHFPFRRVFFNAGRSAFSKVKRLFVDCLPCRDISSLLLVSSEACPFLTPWISLTVEILKLYCRYCRLVFCCSIIFNFYIIFALTNALISSFYFYLSFCKNDFFWNKGLSIFYGVLLNSFNLDCGSVFMCFD